jgi:hypothetical protein
MPSRVIAIDIECAGTPLCKVPVAGLAYYDVALPSDAPVKPSSGLETFRFHGIKPPCDADGPLWADGVWREPSPGRWQASHEPPDPGDFEPRCLDEFWFNPKALCPLRRQVILGDCCRMDNVEYHNDGMWNAMMETIDTWCKEALELGLTPVLVSDNAGFDVGIADHEIRTRTGLPGLLYLFSKTPEERSYTSVRSPNTAWKLRAKGVLSYDSIEVIGAVHNHMPANDALSIAVDYSSYIAAYGAE